MSNPNPKGLFSANNFEWLHGSFSHKRLAEIKRHFSGSVLQMMAWEKKQCEKNKLTPLFDSNKANKVSSILDECKDYYEIEALRKCVFDLNYIPESYEQVKQGADVLRAK